VDYHLLNSSGQKKNKPTFENRFGASQLSLTPLEENINKVNQSWNDDACTDLKEKDGKGTEKEKEKENEAEKEKEEDGEKEEEEEREKDVGEKQKERDVEKDVVRHMDFTDGDSFKQPVEHLSISEDTSSILVLSNTPPTTGKAKEKTKCSSQRKATTTPRTPRKGEGRLNWPVYTHFIHAAIMELYVDDEEDQNGEFMMTKDFYYGKVSMDDFFRDVAMTTMKNVVREKEKREREEKTAVKEEKTAVKEEKTAVKEEKTAVKEEMKVDLDALRLYERLAWDPTNITRRTPPDDDAVQGNLCRNFKRALKGDASVGTGLFGTKSYEDVKLEPTYQTGQKDGPKMTKEAKLIRVMYPFFKKSVAWKCHRHDCITRDEEKQKGWPKPLTAKERRKEAKEKETATKKKRKSEALTRSQFKYGSCESDEDGIWDEDEAEAEQPDEANGFGRNSDFTFPVKNRKRASSASRGFIRNPNNVNEMEEKLKEVLEQSGSRQKDELEMAKAELEFKKQSHKDEMEHKKAQDDRKHDEFMAAMNVLTQAVMAFAKGKGE
jgi:hypothetical protein